MNIVRVDSKSGEAIYINPAQILRIKEVMCEAEIMFVNGFTIRVKGTIHDVVRSIRKQVAEE